MALDLTPEQWLRVRRLCAQSRTGITHEPHPDDPIRCAVVWPDGRYGVMVPDDEEEFDA